MSIKAITMTKINCDGQAEAACPNDSSRLYEYPQAVSLRLARKEGWVITGFVTCPACSGSAGGGTNPDTGSLATVRRPVASAQALPLPPADQPLSIGPGRSSVSRATRQSGSTLPLGWRQLPNRHRGVAH